MALTNHERVGKALSLLSEGLAPFVERECKAHYGAQWGRSVAPGGGSGGRSYRADDVQFQLKVLAEQWNEVFRDVLGRAERTFVFELQDVRNKWAHQESFTTDDAYRALDTTHRLLLAVSAKDQVLEVERLRQELLRVRFDEQARQTQRRTAVAPIEGEPAAGLRPWRDIITPHPDVASGRYQQAEFMADLHQVWLDEGADEYRKPDEFFRRTFLTDGLKQLLLNADRRWRTEGGDPVVDLQTSFGGGKTHSLIALYHFAQGYPVNKLAGVEAMLADAGLGPPPKAATAVLVGQKITPGDVDKKPDGTIVRTLWGELAWQLGGPKGYQMVAAADSTATNPGASLVELLKRHSPALILIDEWVAYARQLYRNHSLPAGTFDTQFTFAQALAEAARAVPGALLVVTIPASDIEVGGEGGREASVRLKHVIGRVESTWRPASAEEGFEIVRRRLFEPISPSTAPDRDVVIKAFGNLYRSQKAEFPPGCGDADYERRMKAAYPIHPELFDRLYGEWSTLDRFQQTRGVLRLMAAAVQQLWERNDPGVLIMPASMPIDAPSVFSELTRYLGDEWKPIIESDVDGPNALPLRLDRDNPNLGRFSATRRIARTIYMGSAPIQQAANRGIGDRWVKLGCVQPGESPAVFGDALRRLTGQATHLYADKDRYWYSTQPSVASLARDRSQSHVTDASVLDEIRRLLAASREPRGDFLKVHVAPTSNAEVPDEDVARLVVIGPEHAHVGKGDSPAKTFALEMLLRRASGDRLYRNMLVFLAADRPRLDDLKQAVRDHLAWRSIDEEKESLNIDNLDRRLIEVNLRETADTVGRRLLETYQWVLAPTQSAGALDISWDETRVSGPEPLAVRASKKLSTEEKLLSRYGGVRLRMDLDKIPLWEGKHVASKRLWDHFAQYLYLPRLRDRSVLADAIADGVASTSWDPDTFAYAAAFDEAAGRYLGLVAGAQCSVAIDSASVVITPEAARTQLEIETRVRSTEPIATEPEGDRSSLTTLGTQGAREATAPARPTRFFGRANLDPLRLLRDMGTISEEIVQRLRQVAGSEVEVTVEINAKTPTGFDEGVQRTISENARTLGFQEHEFEAGKL